MDCRRTGKFGLGAHRLKDHDHHHVAKNIDRAAVASIPDQEWKGEQVVLIPDVMYEGKKPAFEKASRLGGFGFLWGLLCRTRHCERSEAIQKRNVTARRSRSNPEIAITQGRFPWIAAPLSRLAMTGRQ
jgi:hypothetical protein